MVYLKKSLAEELLPILKLFPQNKLRFFPNSEHDFITSLASCRGVISSAGHQLISECLHLQKPMLVIPESGQYEQQLNAEMLEKTGW